MSYRLFAPVFTMVAVVLLAPLPSLAQSADSAAAPRTAFGKPDLQGVWSFATLTPMERPAAFEGKERLTDEDVAQLVAQNEGLKKFLSEQGPRGGTGTYDEFWLDFGTDAPGRRTSLVIDPPTGKMPPTTAAAQARMRARREYLAEHGADSWEDRHTAARCLVGFNTGPPMVPSAYNNTVQLFQTPDHVVIFNEMVHDARIVPLDGSAHLPPDVRQWHGDSRGHWEGDTLVVETVNFTDATNYTFGALTRELHLVERFTRADAGMLLYRYTVNDPQAYTEPWTAEVPMTLLSDGGMYEYACHEGNYALGGILAGARAEEREAAEGISR